MVEVPPLLPELLAFVFLPLALLPFAVVVGGAPPAEAPELSDAAAPLDEFPAELEVVPVVAAPPAPESVGGWVPASAGLPESGGAEFPDGVPELASPVFGAVELLLSEGGGFVVLLLGV